MTDGNGTVRYEEDFVFTPPADAWVCRSKHRDQPGDFAAFKVLRFRPVRGSDGEFTIVRKDQIGHRQPVNGRVMFFPADAELGEDELVVRKVHQRGTRRWCAIATRPGAELPSMWQEPVEG